MFDLLKVRHEWLAKSSGQSETVMSRISYVINFVQMAQLADDTVERGNALLRTFSQGVYRDRSSSNSCCGGEAQTVPRLTKNFGYY